MFTISAVIISIFNQIFQLDAVLGGVVGLDISGSS